MKRGGPCRPQGRAGRPAWARDPRLAAALLLVGALTSGCGAGGSGAAPAPGSSSPASPLSPSPSATSAEAVCVEVVTYWSREVLAGTAYGDYQSMGLSNGQYEILRAAVAAARPVEKRQGTRAAHEVMDRHVQQGCAERYRGGGPSEGPWQ
ncbi:hypothetical protein ACIHFC_12325 [Streptomyces sp. NPDC052013]|uniref:hypothetical protein n=1 Tax=Streptomyces sp. NPDC052013 TaxID=3365679 RepID=UPI0037D70968